MWTARSGHPEPESGFTVVELLIVIAIVSVLALILTLGVRRARESFALRSAASVTLSEVRKAQAAAIAELVEYSVEFVIGTPGALNIYGNTPAAEPCPVGLTRVGGDYCVRRIQGPGNWPPSVALAVGGTPLPLCPSGAGVPWNTANPCVQFRTLGAPFDVGGGTEGEVLLQNSAGTTWRLVVTAGTGRARVER